MVEAASGGRRLSVGQGEHGRVSDSSLVGARAKEDVWVNGKATKEPDNTDTVRVAILKVTVLLAVREAGGGPNMDLGDSRATGSAGTNTWVSRDKAAIRASVKAALIMVLKDNNIRS